MTTYTSICTIIHRYTCPFVRVGPGQLYSVTVNPVTSLCMVTVKSCGPGDLAMQTLNFCIFQSHLLLQLGYLGLEKQQRIPSKSEGLTNHDKVSHV